MQEVKLAIPTEGDKGLEDVVSEVFGKAKTFTIVELSDCSIHRVKVVENPAASYRHGAGPIVVKMLVEMGVTVVAAREFGPGASALLECLNVRMVIVKPGSRLPKPFKTCRNQEGREAEDGLPGETLGGWAIEERSTEASGGGHVHGILCIVKWCARSFLCRGIPRDDTSLPVL